MQRILPTDSHNNLAPQILLVEDNPVNQQVALRILKSLNYQVDIADDGEQALELLKHSHLRYQLIFMDCEMPVKDGFTTTREWRNYEAQHKLPHLPIIALTAHTLAQEKKGILQTGMDDFLAKPFFAQEMKDIIQKWLNHSKLNKQTHIINNATI